jgi:hypothetical protein
LRTNRPIAISSVGDASVCQMGESNKARLVTC